jgi:transposase, IS30 family
MVEDKLELCWSPEQIAGWLRRRFPTGTGMHVSHETIYRSLFVQARGDLRHELIRHLRTGRAMRRPAGARLPDGRGVRPNILNISQRPAEADDRAVPGHWEGDLIFGRGDDQAAGSQGGKVATWLRAARSASSSRVGPAGIGGRHPEA